MAIKYLENGHYLFGNKGAVWSGSAHIAKSGQSTTLCGTPMLSSNHVAFNEIQEPGCKECITIYKEKK